MEKTYWVQVEGTPDEAALEALRRGVQLNDGATRPARAWFMAPPPDLGERVPPVRVRQAIPTAWMRWPSRKGATARSGA
jgi:23S rRNA pseudouridine2457 synthase